MPQSTPSNQKQVVQHEKALNLARRWSVQNENDLLQVSISVRTQLMNANIRLGRRRHRRRDCELCRGPTAAVKRPYAHSFLCWILLHAQEDIMGKSRASWDAFSFFDHPLL